MNIKLFRKLFMVYSALLKSQKSVFHIFPDRFDLAYTIPPLRYEYPWVMAQQVHGKNIWVGKNRSEHTLKGYDGMLTRTDKIDMGIRTADCLPIILYEPHAHILSLIHAGWKGLYEGIIEEVLQKIKGNGGRISSLIVAIGPHIGSCCYSVDFSRVRMFHKKLKSSNEFAKNRGKTWYLDLRAIVYLLLKQYGMKSSQIDDVDMCTCCNSEYFSYRREGEKCGRMVTVAGLRARP